MNMKQFTVLLLGCDLQGVIGGWPAVVGTIMGAVICISADHFYESRKMSKSNVREGSDV